MSLRTYPFQRFLATALGYLVCNALLSAQPAQPPAPGGPAPAPHGAAPQPGPGGPGPGQRLLLGGPGPRPPLTEQEGIPAPQNDAELAAAIRTFADRLAAAGKFSGTIRVEKSGAPLLAEAWGMADRANGRANTPETTYDIASVGKLFTQIAVLQLLEQGRLKLDDTVGRHLPDYPQADVAAKVTVAHLLKHTSGLGALFDRITPDTNLAGMMQLRDFLPVFAAQAPRFEPGTGNAYSNAGYVVLGLIIEAASGENYYDYIDRHVIQPAGLERTAFLRRTALPESAARSYEGGRDVTQMHPVRGSPAGGLHASAGDLVRLVGAINAGKLLSREGVRLLATEIYPPNPFSTAAAAEGRLAAIGFAGGAPGVSAVCTINRDGRYVTSMLANNAGGITEDMWAVLRGWINGLPPA